MKSENINFWLTILFLFCLFGYNIGIDRRSQKEREQEYYDEAAKHIKYGNGVDKEVCDSPDDFPVLEEKEAYVVKGNHKKKRRIDSVVTTDGKRHIVTVTRYNPVQRQCDENPLVTADNSKINRKKLKQGKIKWVAVSRDLRKKFKYGDVIEIKSSDPSINGRYEVHDTMNPRFRDRIDILTAEGDDLGKGVWQDVHIKLVKRA